MQQHGFARRRDFATSSTPPTGSSSTRSDSSAPPTPSPSASTSPTRSPARRSTSP
ncbi:hypothetical protein AB5I41_20810 [Sphingomonas sp. MMS24-JH45]